MPEFEEIIIELSYNCNLSCTTCGFGKDVNPYSKSKFLTFDNYTKILDQVGNKTQSIRLNGRGESTIHPDFVKILNYTKEHYPNININLFSNFSFNNKHLIEAMINISVQLFISMDSSEASELKSIRKGAKFQNIVDNIERVKKIPNRPFIIFTIQEANIHRIYDIARFAYKNKCQILYNTIRKDEGIESFIEAVGRNRQSIANQIEKATELYSNSTLQCLVPDQLAGIKLDLNRPEQTHGTMQSCPALNKELCIFHDGTTTPCNMFNPYVYGNIFSQSLKEIWESPERFHFLTAHKSHYYCQNCANLGM